MTGPVVFIVDDDASVRKATERVLRAAGFETRVFAGARDYLDCYDPGAPGCVLLDLAMPEVNGLALQRELLARGGAPAIVFMSGRADIAASVEAMAGGAVEFLTKPVSAETLAEAVRAAIERDRVMQAAARIGIPELPEGPISRGARTW